MARNDVRVPRRNPIGQEGMDHDTIQLQKEHEPVDRREVGSGPRVGLERRW